MAKFTVAFGKSIDYTMAKGLATFKKIWPFLVK